MKIKVRLARSTAGADEAPLVWPAAWPPPTRGDAVVLADGTLFEVAAVTWCPESEDGPYAHVVCVEVAPR